MKKLTLALACSSFAIAPAVFAEEAEVVTSAAGSSYITGNVQMHDRKDFHGSAVTSTIEAGHTFRTGTTVLVEFDNIHLGDNPSNGVNANSPVYTTLGIEQSYRFDSNSFLGDGLWIAGGYHHVLADGDSIQYRPLIKIGYDFDNGISISNRTRWHLDANNGSKLDDVRMDNAIAYTFKDMPLSVKYNNVYMLDSEGLDHEFRATWTRNGVQPYAEYRYQGSNLDGVTPNNAFVIGASYGF